MNKKLEDLMVEPQEVVRALSICNNNESQCVGPDGKVCPFKGSGDCVNHLLENLGRLFNGYITDQTLWMDGYAALVRDKENYMKFLEKAIQTYAVIRAENKVAAEIYKQLDKHGPAYVKSWISKNYEINEFIKEEKKEL